MNKLYTKVIKAYNEPSPGSIKLLRKSFKPAVDKHTEPVMVQIMKLGITDDINEVYDLIENKQLPLDIQNQIYDSTLYSNFTPVAVQIDVERNAYNIYEYDGLKIVSAAATAVAETVAAASARIALMKTLYGRNIDTDTDTDIDMTLYLTDNKKILNPDDTMLGTNEINSGVSIFQSGTAPQINIFRKEEMNKLIIHEMVHCLDMDDRNIAIDFSKIFNIPPQNDYKVYEAYTEFMAVVINTMISHDKANWQAAFAAEQRFALFQIAKILVYYGFINIAEFNRPYCCDKFRQETEVFSYFFIKAALLFRADEFLARETQSRKIYIEFAKNPQFLAHIDAYMAYIIANRRNIPIDLWNTLRMTINN